jgi:hypothetical protein
MSTAVLERTIEQPRKPDLVLLPPPAVQAQEPWDPHPLLPIFIAGAVSLVLASMLIGSIVLGLALRHSGVMAP